MNASAAVPCNAEAAGEDVSVSGGTLAFDTSFGVDMSSNSVNRCPAIIMRVNASSTYCGVCVT